MELLTAVGWYSFGIITGMLLIEARWRFKISIMDKLSSAKHAESRAWLTPDHQHNIMMALLGVVGLAVLTGSLLAYHIIRINSENEQAQRLLQAGYEYRPTSVAGWYTRDGKILQLPKDTSTESRINAIRELNQEE